MLKNLISIIRSLDKDDYQYQQGFIKATLNSLNESDIKNINEAASIIDEFKNDTDSFFSADELNLYVGKTIKFQINVSNTRNFYNNFSSFLNKNKIQSPNSEFYIKELDYLYSGSGECDNKQVDDYFKNIKLIEILKSISNYQSEIGNDLELFFYKVESGGLKLKINYDSDNLSSLNNAKLSELKSHFTKSDKEERKIIFINEMIGLLKNNNSYNFLLENWDILIDNYQKAFNFYLEDFSFEKIKTSSIVYFQEFTDRVFEQINKATINIFIVPSVYALMLQSFSSSSSNTIQNIVLLITMFIFSLVMHKVLFNNMEEGLIFIESDVGKFKEKANKIIQDLSKELEKLDRHIVQQHKKISMLKWINWIFFTLAFIMLVHIECGNYANFCAI
ncbi:MAG: hypothetical protein HFP81_04800 [Methylococcales symbiont of Hymedesmia sp. n. MRB-2018]|nr:MAG: hypothetical protein HFP81_04800 [Methylococcales symbiont of Hymedesmia sp. n. MRB-2018]